MEKSIQLSYKGGQEPYECEHFTPIKGCAKGNCSVRGDIIQRSRIICPHDYLPKVEETLC